MSRTALSMFPMLFALGACAPAADSNAEAGADAAPEVVAAPEPDAASGGETSEPGAPDPDAAADASAAAPPVAGEGAEGGAPPPGSPPAPEVIVAPGLDESCDASRVQDVIGKKPDQAVVEDAVRRSGAKAVRVIPHDGMMTMDYRGDRLNLQLDPAGKILTATCG